MPGKGPHSIYLRFVLDVMCEGLLAFHQSIGWRRDDKVAERRVRIMVKVAMDRVLGNRQTFTEKEVWAAWQNLLDRATRRRIRCETCRACRRSTIARAAAAKAGFGGD